MTKNSTLSKKLAGYAALAVAGVASVGSANAQVVYTDIPDVTFAAADSFLLDFNNDAIMDYTLRHDFYSTSGTNRQMKISPNVTGNMAMAATVGWGAWNWYGDALVLNDTINAAQTWNCPGGVDPRSCVFFATNYNGAVYGNFADGVDHYLGCKFDISGTVHYGWMRVNIGVDLASMVLKDFAYDAQENNAILAGQMVSGISTALLSEAKVYSYNKNIVINTLNIGGTINIFNNLGQLVKSANIDDTHSVIDMVSAQAGIYLVQIQQGDQAITKRVILK